MKYILLFLTAILLLSCEKSGELKSFTESERKTVPKPRSSDENQLDDRTRTSTRLVSANRLGGEALRSEVRALLSGDLKKGLYELSNIEANVDYETIGDEVFTFLTEQFDPQEALVYFSKVTGNASLSSPTLHRFVTALAETDRDAAFEWLDANLEANGVELAASRLGALDAENATQSGFIDLTTTPEQFRSEYLKGIATAVDESMLAEAFVLFSEFPSSLDTDDAFYTLAIRGAEHDPAAAMDWATTLNDSGLRQSSIVEIAKVWSADSPEEYQQWRSLVSLPKEIMNDLP